MMINNENKAQIDNMLFLLLEDALDQQGVQSINDWLSTGPEAKRYFCVFVSDYVAMKHQVNADINVTQEADLISDEFDRELWSTLSSYEKSAPAIIIEKPAVERELVKVHHYAKPTRKIPKSSLYTAIASIAAILFFAIYLHTHPPRSSVFVGTLENTIGAAWEDPSGAIRNGCDLYVGPMHLTKGFAEILLVDGVQLIFEAPAEFTLESSSQMYLQKGRVTVLAEDCQSPYVVRTPSSSVVDMGTEFGVMVDENQATMTHIYDGLVELRTGSDPLRYDKELQLTANRAGRSNRLGELTEVPPQPDMFIRSQQYAIKLKAAEGSTYHRWLEYTQRLRCDPDLVAYYTFDSDPDTPGVLQNQASSTAGKLNGILGGGRFEKMPAEAPGRWPQKKCLRFVEEMEHCIIVEHDPALTMQDQFSMACWVYLENESSGGHILSKRIGNGDVGYQVAYFGDNRRAGGRQAFRLQFGAGEFRSIAGGPFCFSRPEYRSIGQWWHVAVTFNADNVITFYLNGRAVATRRHSHKMIATTEPLRIGTDATPEGDLSSFGGLMGELAIFKRVISENEVRKMYEAGKP